MFAEVPKKIARKKCLSYSIKLPEIRRIFPEIITNEIVGIQSLKKSTRSIFALKRWWRIMREVTVNKAELIEILEDNRETHEADFERAMEGYYIEAVERHEVALAAAKKKDGLVPHVNLQIPQSHDEDYARALGMLRMDISTTITIDEHEYRNFVEDEWDWKQQWYAPAGANTLYMSKVADK